MLETISKWLANPQKNYDEGVKLYLKARHEKTFDNYFQSVSEVGPNDGHFKLLVSKLKNIERILRSNPNHPLHKVSMIPNSAKSKPIDVTPIKLGKQGKQIPAIDDNPLIRIEDLPADLQNAYQEIKKITPEMHQWHEKAKRAKTDESRKTALNNAANLEERKDSLWNKINEWWLANKAAGMDPEKKKELENKVSEFESKYGNAGEIAQEAIALNGRIEDLKANIARAEKELPKLKDPKKIEKRNKSIKGWNTELSKKEARLKEITGK